MSTEHTASDDTSTHDPYCRSANLNPPVLTIGCDCDLLTQIRDDLTSPVADDLPGKAEGIALAKQAVMDAIATLRPGLGGKVRHSDVLTAVETALANIPLTDPEPAPEKPTLHPTLIIERYTGLTEDSGKASRLNADRNAKKTFTRI